MLHFLVVFQQISLLIEMFYHRFTQRLRRRKCFTSLKFNILKGHFPHDLLISIVHQLFYFLEPLDQNTQDLWTFTLEV